jgi:doubled CXXCH motif protein
MKRLIAVLGTLGLMSLAASGAVAANYHTGTDLICSDCHTAHASQSHGNGDSRGAPFDNVTIVGGPHEYLLRNEVNALCLTCHDNSPGAPDVMGANTGKYSGQLRQAGALNEAGSADENNGHSLGWLGPVPGADGTTGPTTFAGSDGLECTNCHAQHGSATQYRNLLNRAGSLSNGAAINFTGKNLTFELKDPLTTATNTKDVAIRADHDYNQLDVEFEEPLQTKSAYGAWCKTCHTNFHGSGGDLNMGSISGGVVQAGGTPWLRHPAADVNIGGATTDSMTFVSSLAVYRQHAARGSGHVAKVMDANHLWSGDATTDKTITPSCFSCHKGHGNNNPFGLIFMGGNSTISEEGDGGNYRAMCHQCHAQGKDPAQPF